MDFDNKNVHSDSEKHDFCHSEFMAKYGVLSDSSENIRIDGHLINNKSVSVHLIENEIGLRAQMSRRLLAAGFHTEIYAEIQEFVSFAPKNGVILVDDANHASGLIGMIDSLNQASPGMPIVVYCVQPTIDGVVAAMRAHAVNYLSLDVSDTVLVGTIQQAIAETATRRSVQQQIAVCAAMINNLSVRERQVLESLVEGESNKSMARQLGVSPRTVEIHRMKLMAKLGAKSTARAVKIWCTLRLGW